MYMGADLCHALRHEPVLMFGVGDLVLGDGARDRALLIGRPYAADHLSTTASDARDAPGAFRNFFLRHDEEIGRAGKEPKSRSVRLSH